VVNEFKTAHGLRSQPAEMLPKSLNFDYSKVDGSYPCLRIKNQKTSPPQVLNIALTKCAQEVYLDKEVDEFEVDLRGNLITRTTDLYVPGPSALAITRCYRTWDHASRSFGQHTAFSWDMFPVGSRQPYTYLEIIPCDGNPLRYDRISKGTGYADAVYEHRTTNTVFLGSRISWNGNGWDLRLRDGSLYIFPESYHGKRGVDGALIELRDPNSQKVTMQRDERRNLQKISTPNQRWIKFEHDTADRIMTAQDDQGRKVTYLYDHGGRLAEIRGLRSVTRYRYGNIYMTAVEQNGRQLAEFDYHRGRVSRVTLADRGTYRFRYQFDPVKSERVVRSLVTAPDGSESPVEIP
jgi:YD repeat-containing protein